MIDESLLIGKRIKDITVTGEYVELITDDGYRLIYDASDGGYSSYMVEKLALEED